MGSPMMQGPIPEVVPACSVTDQLKVTRVRLMGPQTATKIPCGVTLVTDKATRCSTLGDRVSRLWQRLRMRPLL